jgi:hypothetical protein
LEIYATFREFPKIAKGVYRKHRGGRRYWVSITVSSQLYQILIFRHS